MHSNTVTKGADMFGEADGFYYHNAVAHLVTLWLYSVIHTLYKNYELGQYQQSLSTKSKTAESSAPAPQ